MDYHEYYKKQAESDFPVFRGVKYQTGHGLGGVFKKLFRFIMPIVREHGLPLLRSVGETALKGVSNLASDAIKGKNIKESAEQRFKETFNELKDKSLMKGSGINRKRKSLIRTLIHKKSKKKKKDIFDLELN